MEATTEWTWTIKDEPLRCRALCIKGCGDLPRSLYRFGVYPYGGPRGITIIVGAGAGDALLDSLVDKTMVTVDRYALEEPAPRKRKR